MNEWMNDPKLKKIDPLKLELIKAAAQQTYGKTGKELVPVIFALINSAGKKGITFSSEEFSLIMSLLKKGKNKEEQKSIDKIISTIQNCKKH